MGFIFGEKTYVKDKWNCLDFFVVSTGWLTTYNFTEIKFDALRTLRILKPLKTITKTKKLKIIMFALINAMP